MKKITSIRKAVCTMANELKKKGLTLSEAFRKAWRRIKKSMTLRAAGTTYNGNQGKLAYLSQFKPENLRAILEREPGNAYDSSAIKILVQIPEKNLQAYIGYIPSAVSGELSKVMDAGQQIRATVKGVIGGYNEKEHYGLLLNLAI